MRSELGQLSWYARQWDRRRIRHQLRVRRALTLPAIESAPRRLGSVWGVSVVRDEADILPHVLDHLFAQGIERILVADNRSTDGTTELLRARARDDDRLLVAFDEEPAHLQSEKVSALAKAAWRGGADWIVPFDADEFWFGGDQTVAETLRRSDAGMMRADFHHMFPSEPITALTPETTFMMSRARSVPGKVALRSHRFAIVLPGNHAAVRVGGEVRGLHIAHAQYRSFEQLARKVRQGTDAARLTGEDLDWFSPHWAKAAQLSDEELAAAWDRIRRGQSAPEIGFHTTSPMVAVRPVSWTRWDPDGVVVP